ncbi:MAG: dephospho-CoA kinase [Gammaproteobacteria bacterium]|nr:dephospho-CoA kinase [Gammaproteobacteria bacterium]MCY4218311.1 dephospho-CoA kinase [Gammaproteobacteria bacterium]
MNKNCYTIGLTGGIGSGKSTAANIFSNLGISVLSADQISRELVTPGSPHLKQIMDVFGSDIQHNDGSLDRKGLAKIVFNDPERLKILESILHPPIRKYMWDAVSILKEDYCILEIPLLIETGQHQTVDRVLVVTCDPNTKIQRLTRTRNLTDKDVQKIMSVQLSDQQRIQYAHDVLENDGSLEDLAKQVKKFQTLYSSLFVL